MNTELRALDGSTFKLADYSGKIVLVNLWATWCGPCRSEIPDLIKVSEEYKAKGVEVIGLTNEDPIAEEGKVKAFVRQFNIPYVIGWGDQSFAMALMQGQVRNNIPQSFIISRDGRVLKRFIGFSPTQTPPKLRQALDEAVQQQS
jgi:thiol-disulfide isomerase/thioredoxin